MSPKTTVTILTLLGMASAAAWGHHVQTKAEAQPASAQKRVIADEQAARNYFTDLPLLTQDGKQVRFFTDVLKDKVVLISFVYTECKDACPLLTHKLTLVRDQLEGQLGKPIQFVSISLDPARDTPAALKAFARRHHADHAGWVFLTGESANVNQIIKKLGQYSPDLQSHSTLMLAGNVKTAHWMKIPPTAPPMAIAEKLRLLAQDG
jgi:cytochrome oxidase Cu insertion factor (SCO1/SenC/PrrC family)